MILWLKKNLKEKTVKGVGRIAADAFLAQGCDPIFWLALFYPLIIIVLVPIYTQLYQYQKEPSLIIKAVPAKLASSKEENPVIEVKNIKVPNYLDDYIYRLQPEKDIWYGKPSF